VKTGIQGLWKNWVPAFAGTTNNRTLVIIRWLENLFSKRR
jgi:hypothetical protein